MPPSLLLAHAGSALLGACAAAPPPRTPAPLAGTYGRRTTIGDRPAATTRMPCIDPALGAQEQALLAARAATTRYSITGDVLALADANAPLARSTATEMR
jgi:hypothetical protein